MPKNSETSTPTPEQDEKVVFENSDTAVEMSKTDDVIEAEAVQVSGSNIQEINADRVEMTGANAAKVVAQTVTLSQGGAGMIRANNVSLESSGVVYFKLKRLP